MKGRYQRAGRQGRGMSLSKRLLCSTSLPAFVLLVLPSVAHAQDANRNWDANGTTVGNGGTGTWNTTGPNWSPNTDGTSGPYAPPWDNTLLDNAIFGGTAGTVTLGVPITVHNITFNTANYTLTGNTLTLGGTTPTITVNSGTSTISSIIAGSVGLTKAGAGTLSLTGANTFTGGVVVNTGTLSVGSDAALGNGNTVTLNDGTSFAATGALSTSRQVILNGAVGLSGPGVGSALITGNTNAGALSLFRGVVMSNDANTYTGTTITNAPGTAGTVSFTSVGNTGIASSLGASGEIFLRGANNYIGDGDTSNRTFRLQPSANSGVNLINQGTGTLALTGIISLEGGPRGITFSAESADLALSGTISGTNTTVLTYTGGGTARTIALGGANTYTSANSIGAVTLRITTLADRGAASSLGTNDDTGAGLADIQINGGVLDYRGSGDLSNRTWEIANSSSLLNNGTGGLTLTGAARFDAGTGLDTLTLGGSSASQNTLSGALTDSGSVVMNGAGTWVLGGANNYTGTTTVQNGTLRAGSSTAFGAGNGAIVNGGVLDLNGFGMTFTTLEGAAGTVALGSANLTLNAATGSKIFGGAITGTGSLTKLGASTLTLTGQSTYTGTTTIGGGTLALNFAAAGAPASNIIGASSPLVMSGGTLNITGDADGSSQAFGGLTVTAGNNKINATAGAGALTVDLGAITRSGGLIDFTVPTSANILTSNADGALGGWATITSGTTVKTTDYAQVVGGAIVAFTAYVNKDNAATWLDGEILSDEGGAAGTQFTGTVSGSKQIGGLKYTVPVASTVNIGAGQTLGIDGTIIVSSSVGAANQTINGGSLTGGTGGSTLGVLNNSTGASTFTIGSTIVDNGGATSFAKSGAGLVTLNGVNTYTGGTAISQGTLSVTSIGNGAAASAIGASSSASSNLVIEGATLRYTGAGDTSDRGFTLVTSGAITGGTIDVTQAAANLQFGGMVTSPDNAGLTKLGAGTLTLSNDANDYSGVTTIGAGTLSVDTLANGGVASGIGAASSASSNLVLQGGGELEYTGGTVDIDRGFNLAGVGAIDVANAATTLTVTGIATGGAGATLSKNGAGTLVLSGANTFTAGGFVNTGTLRAGSTQAFGAGGWTVASGAALDLNGFSNTVAALLGSGAVNLGAGTLTISNGLPGTPFSGIISGSGGIAVTGGTQVMSGCNNSYTGITAISGGIMSVNCLANGGVASGIGASSNASSSLVLSGSGGLTYTGPSIAIDRGLTVSGIGSVNVASGTTLGFGGAVVGPGRLFKTGDGVLVLSGINTLSVEAIVDAGVMRAGSTSAFGTGYATVRFAGTLDLANFNNSVFGLSDGATAGGFVTLGSGTLTITNGGGVSYGGVISGSGGLIKNGAGTQGISGCANSYTGSTVLNAGALNVYCLGNGGAASSIGASMADAGNLVLNGGILRYFGVAGSTDRLITLGASGASKIEASGTGAIAFTNAGAIAFSSPNTAQTITLGGTNTGNNSFGLQITNNGTGVSSFTKTDAGTWILTNPNSSYTGITTISGGVLGVDKLSNGGFASSIGASAAAASNLIIGNGSTLRYTGAGDTTNRLFTLSSGVTFIESSGTGAIVFTDTGPVTLQTNNVARTIALGGTNTGNNTLAGSIGNAGTGVTTLAKNDAGTWVLTGTHTYTGPTNINAGILNIGNGSTTGSIASATVNNFGTLGFNRSNTLTYAGTITGTGAVQQLGAGTTILTGTNNYTGGTTISAGTLQLGSGGAAGSIVGNVTNNGTLTFNRNNAYTFAGTISGSGQLTQIGSGTTVLTGTNSYSGGTSITAGTLQVSSDANLGAASGGLSFNGGTLRNTASMTAARAVTLTGAGTFLTDPATTLTLNGVISGAGTLTKTGTGTLTLAADNSYTGLTTISAGTLRIGNGGATGSVSGNVLNNSALVFDRSNTLSYGGTINGSGTVTQAGSGTTVLTGANSYAGATNVSAGTLRINGNQSGATGLTTVFSGAALGGSGTVGGSVLVQNGGTLAPGNSPGVLTINGDLSLSAASLLDFEFGQANVPGGPLNDLINVGGNLTLDGTINVTQSAGGSFGPGVYRILNYGGALTDNGLTVGTLPGGTAFVQTAITNQVNLVNTAGLTLNFWDGPAGPKNDGLIQGGTGTWRVGGGSNDWTEVNGAINADYAQDSFAIFQGTGGTVTVDNGGGNVSATGMQFTVDGYTIAGGPLALTGADALVRVGDGSAGDAGLTATISTALTGSARLVKDLDGTLVLTGTNTYTGGTAINGGTLRVSSDANLGDATGALTLDSGTLNTTASFGSSRAVNLTGAGTFLVDAGMQLNLDGLVAGAGAFVKDGGGRLIFTADNSYTGGTTISAGSLQLGNGGTTGSVVGDILNNAELVLNRSNANTIAGTISGTGALRKIGGGTTILTADNSYTGGTTNASGILQLGAGGTTGGIVGSIINAGTLVFDRSNEYSFDGAISGSGNVEQAGTGTTILTAANSYAGTTTVTAGTLLVNGDQSLATGLTSVASGATLGGIGTIGGDVTLAGGATLAPSDTAGPGTLTINGNLALAGTSRLDYEFGQSNVVGGPLNDLTQVGGNLTLDGTIDVTVTPGGTFGPGLYRVVSYGGTLTDSGLALGAMPAGSTVAVQTSITGQVNLINAAGGTFNFWDGTAPANESNNFVDGGNGTWQSGSGNNDWTTTTGVVSGPYTDGAFAIFAATSGTVSVDNGLGAVTASGLQFASDGYTLTGQDLTLVGPESLIRVGDGTAAGLGFTATVEAALTGTTQLVKADLGTLVLTGTNTYTGGTRIDAGTLRIASDANLGDAAGGLGFNGGTLNTTADIASSRLVSLTGNGSFATDAGTTLTLNGVLSGAGGLTKNGAGSLVFTGANSYGGNTVVTAGSLFINGDQSAAAGPVSVASGATLGGSGIIGGNVTFADGATLAAGTNNVGTLAINGNLALSAGTVLDFEFGQANTVGGSLNDLVTVGGALTLDGTINVSVPASGTFGPGLYRVFNYGGALVDNGLTLGTMPGGSAVSVQTAVAGQVNLVNTAGLTLSFWDGAAGPKNNNVVEGGNGAWRVGGGSSNWTDASGALNADYAQGSFAIFSAAPGTVTVDNVGGAVLASGMQFASDGYVVAGGPLTLTGAQAIVQVGDGSVAGAGYTARIEAELTGTAGLLKTDAGTLVLVGTNSYTGGTQIDDGTLQLGTGGATGSITGDVTNNGTLVVNRSGAAALDGTISGTGSLTKTGSGVLTLAGANSYSGGTLLDSGTLQVSSDTNLGDVAGTLSLQGGFLQAGASFTSARNILLGSPDSNSIDTQGFDVTLGGTIGDGPNNSSGNFVNKLGSGTLTLAGANTYANRTVIAGGTLALAGAGTIGAGNLVVNTGTVFDISQTDVGARVIQLNAGPAGTIALGSRVLTLGFGNSSTSWSGAIADGGIAGGTGGSVVIFAPGGEVRFNEVNSYTGGTRVSNGRFLLAGNGALWSGGAVAVSAGATFDISGLTGTGTTIGDLSGTGTIALGGKSLTFGTSNSTALSGPITGTGGALVKTGTGTFTLTGTNSYTGGTTISGGALQLGDGGASGSIVGDVTNNGALVFNRSDTVTFGGTISGSGAVDQFGSGTTILTGGNSYAGATSVSGGTLLINGDQSLATSATSVVGGGTLGGTGTIGGDVFVGGGATLAPGSNGVGALTINGDLGFSPNGVLGFEFGQANVPGGPLNDLVNVGGDLTLDGTINVTQSAGGSFGPGVYRVINYAGALTNNGLNVGTLPGGTAFVQTAVANQINLVNTAGLTLNFWDGPAGPKNDGTIQGGTGTWVLGGGQNDWTEVNGLVNADYAQDSFAIFQGTGGTVTVDNSGGNVSAAGMQFTAGGYTIAGGPLTLTGAQAFVRVGDGGAGDAGLTATITAALAGSAQLIKDIGGTLVLTGANSYTGGTRIDAGTLQLGNGGTAGSVTGDIVNNAALVTNRSDVLFLDGTMSGSGSLTQAGGGAVILTADNSYTGGTTIASGSLSIGNGGTTGSIVGNVVNNGNLGFARSDTLTFAGTISGSGSVTQQAAGTTILTGTNSYAGETRIAAGTLLVNGDQSAATGATNVLGNTTLGGTGIIGGDVVVADGGALAPGAGGAGALTINGSLSLASGSQLNVDFGAANAVGSPLNDVVNVGGNLTLDGTLNVAVTPGGAFGIGLYRIANYGGTLTDNGLALGTLPAGADVFVQTAVANQVNLINVGGATLNFWDGAAGPKFNDAVDGGSGVWQAGSGNDNWADATGAVNAGYDDGAFAIFTGTAGTVTIDDSLGTVTASGLQFATGGYTITGNALTLTGAQSVIRVGDGTAAGAGYTATIGSTLTGTAQLVKTDLGTLVLTGANSYTGGTAINGGTVRIASDANLGAAAGGVSLNGGTLNTAADLSSARAINLAGAGNFLTDAGTTLMLSGPLSGAGSLTKSGTGTLALSGTGTYAGATNVGAGTLLVNGNYSGAIGTMTVASGASLGGTGTIGGDVTFADGAVLTPGAGGAGTLGIGGNLSLSAGSQLAYEFGQANVAGGTLNDLVNVGGDLVLDGTINVTVPAGGAFDAGIYRVFNYGGALTNNGLTLGALPGGSMVAVQTSIAGQVNLVNSAGLSLAFWDGAVGPKNNGVINGGTGIWQNGTGNDNWANANGTVNAGYSDGAFAVFGGTGGTVTVDNSLGQVTAAGMQFAANGYTITGNAVTLAGPQSTIRVGDGSAAGAGYTATINSVLAGDTRLIKADAGTLVLGGTNSYTGGTAINGGTLQISADANLGAAAGNVTIDGGTLATGANVTSARGIVMAGAGTISTASGTTFMFNGLLSGSGALSKTGSGTLLLTGDSSGFTGSTRVEGNLTVNGSLCGDVNVLAGGRLGGTGTVCTTVNSGTVAPGNSIGTLTVAGSYTGNNGTLEIEAELGGDTSPTDRLVVTGSTSGTTEVKVINVGGTGAATVEGIKIVDVGGASNGVFTLDGDYVFQGDQAVIAGAYGYRLNKGGVATPTDGDWYLRSALLNPTVPSEPQVPLYQPGVPIYEAYGQTLLTLADMGTLQQRIGNRQWAQTESGRPSGIWGRMQSSRSRPNAVRSTSLSDVNIDSWKLELGADHVLSERSDGASLVLGVLGGYGEASASIGSIYGNGSIKTKAYSAGATLSWFGPQGFYVDGRVQVTWFDSKLKSSVLGTLADGNNGIGQAYSVEVGKKSPVGGNLSVTPQIQMVYSTASFDRFTDPNGAVVSSNLGDSLKTRWGLSIDRQDERSRLYAVGNLSYEWLDGTVTDVSGTPIARENHRLWSELGVGGSVLLGDRLTLYTEASANTAVNDFGKSYSLKGTAGLRLVF